MKKVEPIRDKDKIKEMKAVLKRQNFRDYILFELGINSGLRISDLLQLKVKDIKNKDKVELKEQKTDKMNRFPLSPRVKRLIDDYITNLDPEEYLFQSRKGDNEPIIRV